MTPAAAPAPARQQTAALPLPTARDVVALQAVRAYPAVSVLCTTRPGRRMAADDAARLSALIAEGVTRLSDEFGREPAEALAEQLRTLAADAAGRATRSAVALYACPWSASAWSLPVDVRDRAVVDPTFATRDLVRSLHRTPRHVVLMLTDRDARLFDGVGQTLRPAAGSAFPLSRQIRPARRERAGRSERGSRVERDGEAGDANRDAFLRTADHALGTYLRVHPAPLVLVGAQRTLTRFTALSCNTARLAGQVHGSHARTPLPVLVGQIRPVLERYLCSRQNEALALLERRAGAGRVVTGMPAVWLAARAERPEMLAVEQGLFHPTRLSPDGDLLIPATDIEHPEVLDDAVDEVIETVLQRGGWITLVEDGDLATHDRIALTIRSR